MGSRSTRKRTRSLLAAALVGHLLVTAGVSTAGANADSTPSDPEEPAPADRPRRCSAPLRLVASLVNVKRPQRSLAVVRNQQGARLLTLGARLDDLTLVVVQPEFAALRSADGQLCVLPVFDPALRESAPAPRERPAPRVSDDDARPRAYITREQLDSGLRVVGEGSYSIARTLLLRALANPGGAAAGAYFKLRERNGEALGMEVRGVREGSTLSRMGIRTGDLVRSINGIDVSTPLGMLDALRDAREADTITLSVVREGKERPLRYAVSGAP